ncbi:MAG: hypothetical protein Fur0034_07330 [Desulfuromonadia bacterium]
MNIYSRITIASKLRLAFGALLLITLLTGGAGLWGLAHIEGNMSEINGMILHQVSFASEAFNSLVQHNRHLYRHVATDSPETMQLVEAQIQLNETVIRDLFERHAKTHQTPPDMERRIMAQIDRVFPNYRLLADRIVKMSRGGKKGEAMRLLEREEHPLFKELEGHFFDLVRYNLEEARSAHGDSLAVYQGVRYGVLLLLAVSILSGLILAEGITRGVVTPIREATTLLSTLELQGEERARAADAIAHGEMDRRLPVEEERGEDPVPLPNDEAGRLLRGARSLLRSQREVDRAFNRMADSLQEGHEADERRKRIDRGIAELARILRGDRPLSEMLDDTLRFLCQGVGGAVGRFLRYDREDDTLVPVAGFALPPWCDVIPPGRGIAGEAARGRGRIVVGQVPEGYLPVTSSLGGGTPRQIVALPLWYQNQLVGVVELGSFSPLSDDHLTLLDALAEPLSVGLWIAYSRQTIDELLEQAQSQSEELRVQQEELQQSNEELEERAELLERQREEIRRKNRELEETARRLKEHAEELARVSSYKSQFLATISHELRTPLNSILILSSLLAENREGTLSTRQREYAETIRNAGNDLLSLIDEILDLARIESGQRQFTVEPVPLAPLVERLEKLFQPVAESRHLSFSIEIEGDPPGEFSTDPKRLLQILKNLLSNAFKFTQQGTVTLTISTTVAGEGRIRFAVRDTGIGIPADKQELIFQAFQQVDGSSSRRFGGTGLGLTISREIARGLGGDIRVESREGEGSTFTLELPLSHPLSASSPPSEGTGPISPPCSADDREKLSPGDRSILVVEDDQTFAALLGDMVRQHGFSLLLAHDGESGVELARRHHPSAVILDIMLPGIDGWEVMKRLKEDPATRRIPIHVVSCLDQRQKGMDLGAAGYLTKPVSPDDLERLFRSLAGEGGETPRRVLVVEDDEMAGMSIADLLEGRGIEASVVTTGSDLFRLLEGGPFDAVILDLGLPDTSGEELLERVGAIDPRRRPPVIIHTGRELSPAEEAILRRHADRVVLKGARSPERLLNEVTLFLDMVRGDTAGGKVHPPPPGDDTLLSGKKILIVDDDMRNLFSLSSFLTDLDMTVFEAENGGRALEILEKNPDMDLVLMDVMMPEMDGLEATRRIRRDPRFASLPVIILTAKAMKDDRDECLAAGGSDYIQKPVDLDRLLTLLRVWLYGRS